MAVVAQQPAQFQQQYVPVSMVEQSGRQVLLAAQGPGCWSANRQMTLVPSWQQLAAPGHQQLGQQSTAAALLQADASEWGRHLLVDQSGGVHQDQRSIFPVELPDVYETVGMVDAWQGKRNGTSNQKSALFTLQVILTLKKFESIAIRIMYNN